MNANRTPSEINGYPVVAMVKLPQREGMARDMHVVVCANPSIARETTYIVWTAAWVQVGETATAGHWTAETGHYDMTNLDRALIVMCERAGNYISRGR